ncbi:MAG: diguanylate cyclase [Candidatus Contendobacter sp.]|nr:diguanylate cyclase [Candidatus Contendobacter sp.]MDS4057620.1 diguanylate cyclase [Candidatus Contendobacter sp.]
MIGKTILIVEDDGIIAARLQDMLTRVGYTVPEPVASGEAAIAAVTVAMPDLVLMDIKLAGVMDGMTAAEHIRAEFDVPIVYLTAYFQTAQLEQAKATAPYGYLIKPVADRELLATLEMALHRHTLDRRLKESEERLALALWGADLGLWDWNVRADTIICNGPWAELLGCRPGQLQLSYHEWEQHIHPRDLAAVRDALHAHLERRTLCYQSEYRLRRKNEDWIWILSRGKVIERDSQGLPTRVCGIVADISDRKRLEERLRWLAITDPLTGAFNRRYLLQVMEREVSRVQRYARPLSLIMFDIDHFKRINDTFGHEQGDAVLKGVAALVRERLRHSDIFVRWGGEEFMVLATETELPNAIALAETLRTVLRQSPFAEVGPVTISTGVAQYRPPETLDQWLKRVDNLVYQAKREGRDHVSYRHVER